MLYLAFGHSRPVRAFVKKLLHWRIWQTDVKDVITSAPVFNPFTVHDEFVPQLKTSLSSSPSAMVDYLDPLSSLHPGHAREVATSSSTFPRSKYSTASSSEYYIRSSITQTQSNMVGTLQINNISNSESQGVQTPRRIETLDAPLKRMETP